MKITAVIITYNEEIHIARCIKSLLPVVDKIFIVDSFSTDSTVSIAESLGATVFCRAWKNYADQFQWAIDNCGAETGWIMRMDADEYIDKDLALELNSTLMHKLMEFDGFFIRRKVFFQDKWIRYGGFYPQTLLRIWKVGIGKIEQRWMDEHIVLKADSKTTLLNGHIVDDNKKGISFWVDKHNSYASREMADVLNRKYSITEMDSDLKDGLNSQAKFKRLLKDNIYSFLPLGFRSFLYFIYRYVFCLGFLDGSKGFVWHFLQGFWYRLLIDLKVYEIEKKSLKDKDEIVKNLKKDHAINLL